MKKNIHELSFQASFTHFGNFHDVKTAQNPLKHISVYSALWDANLIKLNDQNSLQI